MNAKKNIFNFLESQVLNMDTWLLHSIIRILFLKNEFLLLKEQTEKLSLILSKITPLYLKYSEVAEFFGFPENLHELISFDPGYFFPAPISRYDGF